MTPSNRMDALFIPDTIPAEWNALAEQVVRRGRTLFLLGEMDVGKSTLGRHLAQVALGRGWTVGMVDADVGQSVIGPPTTLGMKLLRSDDDGSERPDALYFAGTITPAYAMGRATVGTRRLADEARSRGADLVIVDTTGMVAGVAGYTLKTLKIEALRPTDVIAVEQSEASRLLHPILRACAGEMGLTLHRLIRAPETRNRSAEARRNYRTARFEAYFADATDQNLSLDEVILSGEPLLRDDLPPDGLAGTIAGILDERGLTPGIAVVRSLDLDAGTLQLTVPPGLADPIRRLRLSDFRLHQP